jgi:SSS family solute:Na+ symporter/sodium/proline symporter
VLGVVFPLDTDYIAIPAVIVSVATLIVVSLASPPPKESDWQDFIDS